MRVRYTRQAGRDLDEIFNYVVTVDSDAAARIIARVERLADLLGSFPFAGRRGRLLGTREMVVPGLPYIVIYRVGRRVVEIVSVVHGARRR